MSAATATVAPSPVTTSGGQMGVLSAGWLLGRRALMKAARNPASLLSAIVFPLLFFALFNIVMRRIMDARDFDYVQLLPSTVIVQAMLFSAMSSAYYVAEDRLTGISGRLRSMPIHPAAPFAGRAFADVGRGAISLTVLLVVAFLSGMRFEDGVVWLPLFAVVALSFVVAAAVTFGLLGYMASSPESAVSLATIPYLPLLMLSSGFAPVDDFPGWLQPFVEWQPITATIDALRALTGRGDIAETVPLALGWSAAIALVFGSIGVRRARRVA